MTNHAGFFFYYIEAFLENKWCNLRWCKQAREKTLSDGDVHVRTYACT